MLKYFRLSVNFRFYSIKHAAKQPVKYTDTINLPKTKFPSRLTAAKREEIERQLLQSKFASTYSYQEAHNKEPTFVLHDGPPYANGDLHMGHAVNKILKDICLREHVCQGTKVNYIPGWDCHGLPIELKATAGETSGNPLAIRQKSRQYALTAIQRQKEEFVSWGILANWSSADHVYLTFQPEFIVRQLEMFFDFYERGLVFRDLKPVYWSPSSKTALAEAELEYDANYVSPSVYLRFALSNLPASISHYNKPVYALVWTTTPWTLPSNQAICYSGSLDYALVKLCKPDALESEELYLLAANLIGEFESTTKIQCRVIDNIKGTALSQCTYQHLMRPEQENLKFFEAAHVQDNKGTGLVHTAPAHGPEDFLVSLAQKMPVICYVNEEGIYTADAPVYLRGKSVLGDGNRLVLENIPNHIVFAGKLTHSYPIDWRTKKPVIIRASEQWFMNTELLKRRATEELTNIEIYPRVNADASKKALEAQVRKRPYWCISRQRVWGVPIPVFYDKHNGKVITNKKIIKHICALIREHGNADFWWSQEIVDILPQSLLVELGLTHDCLIRGTDIFDIWFDSGSTWSNVLSGTQQADLYLEGYDQFTGWFQSSLLTSVAARNCAPYKSLFVHGFTVDEQGYKMSKSLGNVISPKEITKKYGVDVLRWWVASHATQHMSITVGDKLLQQSAESVSKVRAILRYLNGAIGVRDKSQCHGYDATNDDSYINKYMLSNLVDFNNEIQRCYSSYEYNRVVALIQNFIANQISTVYVHTIKDRMYCGGAHELANIRSTLVQCYELLCKVLWPLTPFLVEESWSYYNPTAAFYTHSVHVNPAWKNEKVTQVVNTALNVKRLINQTAIDVNSWTLAVEVSCAAGGTVLPLLRELHTQSNDDYQSKTELCEILQVNSVKLVAVESITNADAEITVRVEPLTDITLCPRCRRFALKNDDATCERCTNVLKIKC